jgi:RHS repeat-associated protein
LWIPAAFIALFVFSSGSASAKDIGADPPKCPACPTCQPGLACPQPQEGSSAGTTISRTEGNLSERINLASVLSSTGPTLAFSAIYNSYNADGSRVQLDTVMGYGWTHSYNIFLFSQLGSMFRFGGDGRVTRYKLGPGGTFTAAPGYFETLVKNPDGSFTLTTKDKTVFTFRFISGTSFFVVGPVYRLTTVVDRNGNTTTLTYAGGNLASVADTYGRSLTFTYTAQRKVASVTDPAGRVSVFQYDPTGRQLTGIVDPDGRTISYTYNYLYQLTNKVDRDGRTFSYTYANGEPTSVNDSTGSSSAHLSNPGNWATSATQLALTQSRVYIPSTTTNTDGRGNAWQYQYDANGYTTSQIAPDGATTQYAYDPATLMVASKTDPNGHTTTCQYDTQGNCIRQTNALGQVTNYTYEPVFNMMTSMTDPRGRNTSYAYDVHGNRIQETDPLGQTRTWTYDIHGNVLTETDKDGHTTSNQYDSSGDRTRVTDALGNVTTMTYDPVGNVLTRTDANGHTVGYQYDGLNRRTQEIDAVGNTTQTQYDGEGNQTQITDRNGHTTGYQYDLRQRMTTTTDAVGNVDTATYDGNDNRTSMTDRNGHTTSYQYDVQNRLTRRIDALGDVTTSAYDPEGNVISQTDANGHATLSTYDALDRRVSQTDAIGNVTQTEYDGGTLPGCPLCGATPGSGLVTKQTDANGKVTYFKYDALDRLIRIVRKVGSTSDTIVPGVDAVVTYTYDPVGNRLTETEPNGNTTTFVFDADNRRVQETNAAGDITRWTYDGVDNVTTVTAPNGNVTATTYDVLNRPTVVTDSVGVVARYTYDAVGNRLTETDGNNHTTGHTYDALNRMITTTDPLGRPATMQYDAVGNVVNVTDRNGHPTNYLYDAINRRVSETDPLGNTTTYGYDAVGNRVAIKDANGNATQYQYDAINRLIMETYADGRTRAFTYDGVGNVLTRTDQIGQVTTYSYNDLYFLLGRSYPSLVNDTFTYDLSGRTLSAQHGTWLVTFVYDGANRVVSTTQNGKTVAYSYNIPGRTRTIIYPGGRSIVEHTDPRSRLNTVDDALSPPPIAQYTYDLANNVTTRVYRNGTTGSSTYNANDWVTSLEHTGIGSIARFNYDYDNEGNKKFEEKTHIPTRSEAYQYDAADRLIDYKVGTLIGSTVPLPATQTAYNLDPVGNWPSKITDAVTQTRVHDVVNELVKIDATNLTYDANGNAANDGAFSYVYDEENRLIRVTRNSDAAIVGQYQYDALGRRVVKVASPAITPTTTVYFLDDARVVEEQNGVGTTQATYVYGNYVDEVLTMDRGGQTYYFHQNAMWSVEAITNSGAAVVERYSYDAYGSPAVTDGSGVPVPPNPWGTSHSNIGNPYMFTGREFDEETGLYYYRARYHDPAKGRFIQRDPDGTVVPNAYSYADNNPTNRLDPTGTTTVTIVSKHTTGCDAFLWWWKSGDQYRIGTTRTGDDSDPSGQLAVILERYQGCISELNLSGHGYGCGISTEDGWRSGINQNMPADIARRIAGKLCKGATVNICSCSAARDAAKHQRMANKLQAKVCACTGTVSGRCSCDGTWVCLDPNDVDDAVLRAREAGENKPKKKK